MRRVFCKTSACRKWSKLNAEGFCPSCVSNTTESTEVIQACICDMCKKEVDDSETKALGCDLCKNWFHPECVGDNNILDLLDAVAHLENEGNKFVGCLLWLCPACISEPKKIELNNGNCNIFMEPEKVIPKKTKRTICKNYRLGKCNAGDNCEFSHPDKCLNYCRYGREGCRGGFQSCNLLHPVLCRDSLNYRKCFNESCTLAHLKGTNRNPQSMYPKDNGQTRNYPYKNTSRRQNYSTYNRDNLGFRGYQVPHQRSVAPLNKNYSNGNSRDNFTYNETDFPDTLQNGFQSVSQPPPPNQGLWYNRNSPEPNFLDVLKTIQKNQLNFQQELMSIRMFLPQIPVNQNQLSQGYQLPHQHQQFFNQPQHQSQAALNQES